MQIISTGLDQATASIQLQQGNDGINFIDIPAATITMDSGTNPNEINIYHFPSSYLNVVLTVGTCTTGTIDINVVAK